MKKALIFMGLVGLVSGTIYLTTLFSEGGDPPIPAPPKNKKEMAFNSRISNLESQNWLKDSIENLKMDIQVSRSSGTIDAKIEADLLKNLEDTESKCLQNSFKYWVNNSNSYISSDILNRMRTLAQSRPNDRELKKRLSALNSYNKQNELRSSVNSFMTDYFDFTKYNSLKEKIETHLNNRLIKNHPVVRNTRIELITELDEMEGFHRLFCNDRGSLEDIQWLHRDERASFSKYPKYEQHYQNIINNGLIQFSDLNCDDL